MTNKATSLIHPADIAAEPYVGPYVASAADYLALLKPRVMSLVIFTAFIGLIMAPGHIPPVIALTAILCIAVGAGAAGCLNMWYEADIDALMKRTRTRPVAAGRISRGEALGFGASLAVASVTLMGLAVNAAAAALLALTIGFYVFIYTMWLKRRTPQNIVIGGAAGAFPPMIGWAAVTGDVGLGALVMFAIIFFWTPPHFWALSLYTTEDYKAAGIPMLPVVAGGAETRRQILLYSVLLAPLGLAPLAIGLTGWLYGAVAAVLGVVFLGLAVQVYRQRTSAPQRLFRFSLFYMAVLFLMMVVDRLVMGAL